MKKYFTLSTPNISKDETPKPSLMLSSDQSELSPNLKRGNTIGHKGLDKHEMFLHSYKDHILFGKEVKILEKFKKFNDIQVGRVNSHVENNSGDNLVLTRRLNHPELIYN